MGILRFCLKIHWQLYWSFSWMELKELDSGSATYLLWWYWFRSVFLTLSLQGWIRCIVFQHFFFFRFYLFIHERHTERHRQRQRQREKQAPCREPDVGLDPASPGSCPGLKAALNLWATQAAPFLISDSDVNISLIDLMVQFGLHIMVSQGKKLDVSWRMSLGRRKWHTFPCVSSLQFLRQSPALPLANLWPWPS